LSFYKIYSPPAVLDGLIREFQLYHINFDEDNNSPLPFLTCLANNEQNLYFFVNDPMKIVPAAGVEIPAPSIVVTGPKYKPVGLLFGKDHLMIKVAFHPTGTYRLLGIDMQATVNAGLDAAGFWGNEVVGLLNQLRQTSPYDSMIAVVSSYLEQKFAETGRPEEPIDHIAVRMLNPLSVHSLEEWALMACLSLRQFERNFITRVGISPKLFLRIVRFEYSMKVKNLSPDKSWAAIASECGYTDSSHLLREFKEFAEFPPSQFYCRSTSGYSEFPTG
jgi:AraC-like DNA-binding protein